MAEAPTYEDTTFIEVLQAHAAGLLADREAADVLRRIRPDWFPTDKQGIRLPPLRKRYEAMPRDRDGRWIVTPRSGGGYIAEFPVSDSKRGRLLAELLADTLNENGEPLA